MKMVVNGLLAFILLITSYSCDTTEPPEESSLILTIKDVSCTEAWLKLTTTGLQLPKTIILKQDDAIIATINLIKPDTLLYIDALFPNRTYSFQTIIQSFNQTASEKVTTATMDTTSHNFTWETFTFGGDAGSCVLNDVAIIAEDDIWAVGEIYMNDSLGNPDPNAYNAVHWDGIEWELKRIPFTGTCSAVTYPAIRAIWSFSNSDIWFARGGSLVHFDGLTYYNDCGINSLLTGSINKIWGTSSNDLYVVGNDGNIAHYQNEQWNKIESGTTTIINDIWGFVNDNDEIIAYCAVSSFFTLGDKKILRIKNNQVESVSWGMDRRPHSVWTNSDFVLYACGEGIFENKNNNWKEINITSAASNKIRGNDLNDILVIGDFGFAAHYNGVRWKPYDDLFNFNSGFRGISVKENIVAIAGRNNGYGIITIGRKN